MASEGPGGALLLPGPASVWGWEGPGFTSRQLPIAASGFSAQAKSESQGGDAGTCSAHSLSPGAALQGTGLEVLAAQEGVAAFLLSPPLCHPDGS